MTDRLQAEQESDDAMRIRPLGNGLLLTMTSTVSYKLTTTPFSSTIGTADMLLSENICTTSKTGVDKDAVAIGQ